MKLGLSKEQLGYTNTFIYFVIRQPAKPSVSGKQKFTVTVEHKVIKFIPLLLTQRLSI